MDTFDKSYNDILLDLNSFNSTMLAYQNNLLSLKDSVQQITQNVNVLNIRQANMQTGLSNLSNGITDDVKETGDKLQVFLSQLTNQESQIVSMENKLNNLSAEVLSEKKILAPREKSSVYTVYVVKQGDTISEIAWAENRRVEFKISK